jgi:plasmid maintenance system antidote protein VapI
MRKKLLPSIHPGVILREKFMKHLICLPRRLPNVLV